MNNTSVPPFQASQQKSSFFETNKLIIGLISVIVAAIGIVSAVILLKKPITRKVPAVGPIPNSVTCNSDNPNTTKYGLNVVYTFENEQACLDCQAGKDPNCPQNLVGQPSTVCRENGGTATCSDAGSCNTGTVKTDNQYSCTISADVPPCSVAQLDCSDSQYPNYSNISGLIKFNCQCLVPTQPPQPTNTPGPTNTPRPPTATPTSGVPTNTPAPTSTPPAGATNTPTPSRTPTPTNTPAPTRTPTPTITPGGPTLTPTPTSTPGPSPTNTPAPTSTPPPGATATPIPQGCGIKACDNTTNPCQSGLICVQANDGSNYCTFPEFQDTCRANPTQTNCCTLQGNSPTPTETVLVKTTSTPGGPTTVAQVTEIPSAGVSTFGKIFGVISIAVILLGLIL